MISDICSLLRFGEAEGIFNSRYSIKPDTSPEILNWDKQTGKHHSKIAWHSSSPATPRVLSATIYPPASQQVSQFPQGLPERTLPSYTEQVSRHFITASTDTSTGFETNFWPSDSTGTISALQHNNCCNIKLRRDHLSKCCPQELPYVKLFLKREGFVILRLVHWTQKRLDVTEWWWHSFHSSCMSKRFRQSNKVSCVNMKTIWPEGERLKL